MGLRKNMDNKQALMQLFINNLNNKLTPELANGMLMEIIKLIPVIETMPEGFTPPSAKTEE